MKDYGKSIRHGEHITPLIKLRKLEREAITNFGIDFLQCIENIAQI